MYKVSILINSKCKKFLYNFRHCKKINNEINKKKLIFIAANCVYIYIYIHNLGIELNMVLEIELFAYNK